MLVARRRLHAQLGRRLGGIDRRGCVGDRAAHRAVVESEGGAHGQRAHRRLRHSQVSVPCRPVVTPRRPMREAPSTNHGVGAITEVWVTMPSTIACSIPSFTDLHIPRSSACTTSRIVATRRAYAAVVGRRRSVTRCAATCALRNVS